MTDKQDKGLNPRAILQTFANWWAEYTKDEHYTGNSYCLEVMQEKTDECLSEVKAHYEQQIQEAEKRGIDSAIQAYESTCEGLIEEAVKAERESICQFLIKSKANLLDIKRIADGSYKGEI